MAAALRWQMLYILIAVLLVPAKGQGLCNIGNGDMTGVPTTISGYDPGNPPASRTFIMYGEGSSNCYGVVAEWRAVVRGGCTSTDLDFEVWREITRGSSYQLVGRNNLINSNCVSLGNVANSGVRISLRVPENSRIPIADGDVIGWTYRSGEAIYITGSNSPKGAVFYRSCGGVNPGSTCSSGSTTSVDPLIEARLVRGPGPSIDNLNSVVEVYENEASTGATLFKVLASHPSGQAREGTTTIVDQPTAVLFTFYYDTSQPFSYTPGANRIGELTITTAAVYNFESRSQYVLPISVTGLYQNASGVLTVNILDRNDPHTLDNLDSSTSASVLDTTCQTNPIYTVTYSDEDDPNKFPAKRFYIMSTNPALPAGVDLPFIINENTGEVFCTTDLQTWTTSMGTSYDLQINVVDGMHAASGILTVDIQQTLDPPFITNLPRTQQIYEDLLTGSEIFHVFGDGPSIADIRFSIDDVSPRKYFYYFILNETSGVITLSSTAVLDYSIQQPSPSFTITVGIKDNLQTGTAKNLQVDLKWVNRRPAYNPDEYYVTIPEECGGATACKGGTPYKWQVPGLSLSIEDRDVDNPGPGVTDSLTCDILPSFGSGYFTYQKSPAPYDCSKLFQDGRIDIDDRPENRQINLTVWVKDETGVNNNDKGDLASIYITVTDINDNYPVFINVPAGSPPYIATIPENTPGGVSLFTVTATDKDSGTFGEIKYTLEDNDSYDTPPPLIDTDATQHFEIDPENGRVQTKQYLDYEAINPKEVFFTIRATDGGGLSTTTLAKVIITNVNDIRPVWKCDSTTLRDFNDEYLPSAPCFFNDELRSDTSINYEVLSILSTDVDSDDSAITYHLLEPSDYFGLGKTDGMVKVINDLGTYVKYILYCYSQDNGDPNLISQPSLRVRLDTFDPRRQLIEIVMNMPKDQFDETQQNVFQKELRKVLAPWFPKISDVRQDKDSRTTVSVYALRDNSSFDEDNLDKAKQFVDRNELLKVLRKDLYGTPRDVLKSPQFQTFDVILVEPTYPIWLIDTIPGIITLSVICLLAVALILGLILGLCSRYEKCCFKKSPKLPERRWLNEAKPKEGDNVEYDRLSEKSDQMSEKSDQMDKNNERPKPRDRRLSVDTVHSLIYDTRLT